MNRFVLSAAMTLACCGSVSAQTASQPGDVLGPHLNFGRGCNACHAPHSGVYGNGAAMTADSASASVALWGENARNFYSKTTATGEAAAAEPLPTSLSEATPDVDGLLACLTCHDGNFASPAAMKNTVYETLPATYGKSASIPTLLGDNGAGAGKSIDEHPVGLSARLSCGGSSGWDCAESEGNIRMKGAGSSRFVANYGFFVKPRNYNNAAVVMCTTCHDQHVMNVVEVTGGSASGLPKGDYATMFFLRGPYDANSPDPRANHTAQFCRQCHGDLSNEMNGSSAGTVF